MRLWYMYLSHRRPAKARASLRIRAVSPKPLLFAHVKYGRRRRVWPKIRHLVPLDDHKRVCRMNLRRTKSTIISWHGSFLFSIVFVPLDCLDEDVRSSWDIWTQWRDWWQRSSDTCPVEEWIRGGHWKCLWFTYRHHRWKTAADL